MTEDLTDQDAKVKQYVWLRDDLKRMDDKHKEDRKEHTEILEKLEGQFQAFLDKTGSTSVKTAFGTFYSSTRYTTSLVSPDTFMDFVIEMKLFDLIDRRANAAAVRDYVTEKG